MKIGIDIDEVVASFLDGFLKIYNKKYGTNVLVNEITSYKFWECLPITKEESVSIADEFYDSEHFEKINLVDGAVDAIKNLSSEHKIIFITSRPLIIKEKTEEFIKKIFPEMISEIFFSGDFYGGELTKSEVCKAQNVDFLVEDNKHYAIDCAKNGTTVFLLDKPWNKNHEEHPNIVKVMDWEGITNNLK